MTIHRLEVGLLKTILLSGLFVKDYGLVGCKDYLFISAISGIRSQGEFTPLYAMRGLPDDFALSSTLGDKYQLDGAYGLVKRI